MQRFARQIVHGVLEVLDVRLGVCVELVDQVGQLLRVGELDPHNHGLVLKEHGLARVFEDRVREWIAWLALFGNLGVEIVAGVLGFPVAARQAVRVAHGAVGNDALAAGLGGQLGHERPVVRPGRVGEHGLEGGAQGAFVRDMLVVEALQGLDSRAEPPCASA